MTSPTPSIPIFNTGDTLTQSTLAGVTSNLTNLYNFCLAGFRTRKPITILRVTGTTQSVPNGINTVVNFDIADVNYDNSWVGTARSSITINTAGVYDIYCQYSTLGAASVIGCYITVNGTNPTTDAAGAGAANGSQVNCSTKVALAVGAVVTMVVIQNTGSAQNILTTFSGTRLVCEWLSP